MIDTHVSAEHLRTTIGVIVLPVALMLWIHRTIARGHAVGRCALEHREVFAFPGQNGRRLYSG